VGIIYLQSFPISWNPRSFRIVSRHIINTREESKMELGIYGGNVGIIGPGGVKNSFFFFCVVQTGSGAHPACYPKGTGGSFLGGKAAGT
jgi:hypothetical protein